jgi:hypothetical protein
MASQNRNDASFGGTCRTSMVRCVREPGVYTVIGTATVQFAPVFRFAGAV